jgi:acid phosphatase type 7
MLLFALSFLFFISLAVARSPHKWKANLVDVDLDASVSIIPSTSVILQNLDFINISISNPNPDALDAIVLYAPSTVVFNETYPIEWFVCADIDAAYLSTGNVTATFRMVNLRTDFVLVLVKSIEDYPNRVTVIGTSQPVIFANANEPRSPRLTLSHQPNSMVLTWSSLFSDLNPRVLINNVKTPNIVRTLFATSSTYTRDDMCNSPANSTGWFEPGMIHSVVLDNLIEGEVYNYTFGDDSALYRFPQQFSLPSSSYPLQFVAFGDMGQVHLDGSSQPNIFIPSENTTKLINKILQDGEKIDAVLHIGDLSYAMGVESIWDSFLSQIGDPPFHLSGRIPWSTIVGNHESDEPRLDVPSRTYWNVSDAQGECSVPAVSLFPNPGASVEKPWYKVQIGPVRILFLSSEHNLTTGSPQHEFVKAALNETLPVGGWSIVGIHRPSYADCWGPAAGIGAGCIAVAKYLREYLDPLLLGKVDFVISGHFHDYQRASAASGGKVITPSIPQADGSVAFINPKAPVHVLVGSAGADLSCCHFPIKPDYTEFTSYTFGVIKVKIWNQTHLEWRFMASSNYTTVDHVWIVRGGV